MILNPQRPNNQADAASRRGLIQVLAAYMGVYGFMLRRLAVYYLIGVAIGILAWLFGAAALPPLLLRVSSGFGWRLVVFLWVALSLLFVAQRDPERFGPVAGWFARASARALTKAITVLLGLCTVALICWRIVGSQPALGTLVIGLFLASLLLFFLWCLRALRPTSPACDSSGN